MASWFLLLFDALRTRRWIVWLALVTVISVCAWITATSLRPEENIAAMLPDDDSRVAHDFHLLQQAPFVRRLMITIHANDSALTHDLNRVGIALEKDLQASPLFTEVSGGFDPSLGMKIMEQFNRINPALLTESDYRSLNEVITADAVEKQVKANFRTLMSPDGMMSKQQIMDDPLGVSQYSLEKLKYVQLVSNLELKEGRFVSKDGMHALLIGETAVEMTDSGGGRQLMDAFDAICKTSLPPGFSAEMLSSHRYTVANAELVQRDLSLILTVTTVGILIIFVLYMRCWRAIVIFLFPAVVILVSLAMLTVVYDTVSGVTLGFGAVLMGISIDFALHIYFATREAGDRRKGLQEVLTPGLVCALTTIAAFAVLQASNLPGQRQLSLFAVTGIIAAVVLAFVALPHIIPAEKMDVQGRGVRLLDAGAGLSRKLVLGIWVIVMIAAVPGMLKLTFDGNLRRLNAVPPELQDAETRMSETWGDFRSRAMIFAEGQSVEDALAVNDRVFAFLEQQLPPDNLLSLSAILPSTETQKKRHSRWQTFKDEHVATIITNLKNAKWPPKAVKNAEEVLNTSPPFITPDDVRESGLGNLIDSLVVDRGTKTYVITMVPEDMALAERFDAAGIDNAYFVSQKGTGDAIGIAIGNDFRKFITYALVVVVVLVLILYRKPSLVLAALSPVISGVLGLFAFMGMAGVPMNMFNVIASILIIGLGVDYGIFMVHKTRMGTGRATTMAVWVSALTTMAGFGALILGRHPALFSIGLTVSVGIVFSILTALFVVPALVPQRLRPETTEETP